MDGISKDVFAAGDHLVILYHGSASDVDEFGPASMPHIDIANLDGSERKTLITLDAACEMNPPILSDGNSLVFLTTVVQQGDNSVSSTNQLVRIPFDGGKMQVLYDFSANALQGNGLIDSPWNYTNIRSAAKTDWSSVVSSVQREATQPLGRPWDLVRC